jgi:hypothetical protein
MSITEHLKEDLMKQYLFGNSSGYESNSENDDLDRVILVLKGSKRKAKKTKTKENHSDEDTADVSRFDERFLKPIRKFYNQEDNKPKDSNNLLNEVMQLITQIYTNVSADKIQFLNISSYEKHFMKYFLKDKYYIHTFLKCLIESLSNFIKVKVF